MKLLVIVFSLLYVTSFFSIVSAFYNFNGGVVGSYSPSPSGNIQANSKMNPSSPPSQKNELSPAQQKLSSDLLQRVTSISSSSQNALLTEGDHVYVYVYMNPPASTHIIDPYVLNVTDRDEQNHIAVAWVNINNLEQLASLPEVRQIQTVTPPQTNQGAVTESSDRIVRMDLPVDHGSITLTPAGTGPQKTAAAPAPGLIQICGTLVMLTGIRVIIAKKQRGECP